MLGLDYSPGNWHEGERRHLVVQMESGDSSYTGAHRPWARIGAIEAHLGGRAGWIGIAPAIIFLSFVLPALSADIPTSIEPVEPMVVARKGHTATSLSDGRVLVIGGMHGSQALAEAELFDPAKGAFRWAGRMGEPRAGHSATLLHDGRVLVVGGKNFQGTMDTAEIFDPQLPYYFHPVISKMAVPRHRHTANLLKDGRVIIVGGDGRGSTELFDPKSGLFIEAFKPLAEPRLGHSATVFADDSILVAGGGTRSAEFLDAETGRFHLLPMRMGATRSGHAALPIGHLRLLFVGGDAAWSVEEFDGQLGQFGHQVSLGTEVTTASLLANGNVLLLGSEQALIYWPDRRTFEVLPGATELHRRGHSATELLADKRVLVTGGEASQSDIVDGGAIYNPAAIRTDQTEYAPASRASIQGRGFKVGEEVELRLARLDRKSVV